MFACMDFNDTGELFQGVILACFLPFLLKKLKRDDGTGPQCCSDDEQNNGDTCKEAVYNIRLIAGKECALCKVFVVGG